MTRLADIALGLLGVYLSLRLIAASYRVLDLWYTIRTAYPKVIRGLLGWGGTTLAIAGLLDDRRRRALLWGMAAFVFFYLGLYALRPLVLRKAPHR